MTPISNKLFTNYVPLFREVSELRGVILHLGVRHSALEADMNRVRGRIDHLSEQYNKLTGFGGPVFLVGFDGFPVDLVEQIFLQCLPTEHHPVISSSEPPLLLTRILKGWTRIALGIPHLWSSLHLPTLFSPSAEPHNLFYRRAFHGLESNVRSWLE